MSLTIALAVAPTTNATLSAALSTEIGETQPIAITQQTAVEAHELSATAINEAWAGVDAASQAALLGTASDATLAALPQLHREQTGKGFLLASKLDAEAAAFVGTLLNCVGSSAAIGMQSDPLSVAETAAELRNCSSADALKAISALPETVLGAVSRAFGAQGSNGLISHLHKLLGSSGQLRALLQARIERAAALPEAAGKGGGGHSHPSAARAARRLHAAGKGLFCGTDEDTFIEVLGFASPSFAAAIRYEYAMRFGHTLASAVRDEMRGDLQALLLAFLNPPPSVASSIADAKLAQQQASDLHEAAKGMGTHTKPFIQIFGSVSHAQLNAVLRAYEAQFGRPLVEMLREEFVFDLNVRKLCVTRCKWAAKGADEAAITPGSPSTQTAERRVSIGLRGHLTVTSPQKDPAEAFQPVSLDSLPPSRPGQLLLVRVESHDPAVLKRLAALQSSSPDAVVKAVEIPKRLLPPPAATTTTAVKSPVTPSPITPAATAVLSPRGVNVAAASAARTPTKPLITPVLSPAIMSLNKSSVTAAATLARTVASTPPLRDSSNSQPPPSRPNPAAQTPTKPAATAVTRPAVRTPLNSSNQPQQPVARGAVAATVARPPSPVRPPSPLGVFSATAPATTSDWPSLRQEPPAAAVAPARKTSVKPSCKPRMPSAVSTKQPDTAAPTPSPPKPIISPPSPTPIGAPPLLATLGSMPPPPGSFPSGRSTPRSVGGSSFKTTGTSIAGRAATAGPHRIGRAPATHHDIKQSKQREAWTRLVTSSTANLEGFEVRANELEQAAADAEARGMILQQLARGEGTDKSVQRRMEEALVSGEHASLDMREAVAKARRAIANHRNAHEILSAKLASPGASNNNLVSEPAALRDAIAECRKQLRLAEQTFTQARGRAAAAASAVQGAVAADRKKARVTISRPQSKPFESRALS